jgi:predicted 2-oxoglutarate/Fe(II)-dependent dioxygenase YbiX
LGAVQRQVKLPMGDAMLHSVNTLHAADPRKVASAGRGHVDQAGVYLTDEVFLYRVVDRVITAAGEMVEVEDCYWLDVVRIPANDLAARQLRVVTPS